MQHVKAITEIPGWQLGTTESNKITTVARAYEKIPIINDAVNLRSDALTAVPAKVYKGEAVVDWPFPQGLTTLLWKTEASMLTAGAGYWLKIRDRAGRVKSLQWLNPTTITVTFDGLRKDGAIGLDFEQAIGATTTHWDETHIVYFREWGLSSDVSPGPSATQVALDAGNLHYQMTRFAKEHFEKGAMPVVLLPFEKAPKPGEAERIENWFKRQAVMGLASIGNVLALNGKIEPKILSPEMDKLAMPELAQYALRQVANAFRIPQTMLDDAANFATASAHDLQFWRNTILPRLRIYEGVINEQLLDEMSLTVKFAPNEMDVFQVDEEVRAGSYSTYVSAGMKPSISAEMLGLELPEGVEYSELDAETEPAPPALPDEGKELPQRAITNITLIADDKADLKRWQKKALNSYAKGKGASVPFDSEHIAEADHDYITEGLKGAATDEDIKAVFEGVEVKSQAAMRRDVKSAVRGLWTGDLDRLGFDSAMVATLRIRLTQAWHEGAGEVGITPDDLTETETDARDNFIRSQTAFIQNFADAIVENREAGGKLSALDSRVTLWANRYGEAKSLGLMLANSDQKLVWKRGATEEGCKTCKGLDGRVYRASVWVKNDVRPRGTMLECDGHRCQCTLTPTDNAITRGRFPRKLLK